MLVTTTLDHAGRSDLDHPTTQANPTDTTSSTLTSPLSPFSVGGPAPEGAGPEVDRTHRGFELLERFEAEYEAHAGVSAEAAFAAAEAWRFEPARTGDDELCGSEDLLAHLGALGCELEAVAVAIDGHTLV